ncbi:MAG: VanZ family protein [Lachnospira sp.]
MSKLINYAIRIAVWIPVVLMAIVIFGFSSQNSEESSGLSHRVAEVILEGADYLGFVDDDNREELIEELQFPIRKCAHMTEYAVFAILILTALYIDTVRGKRLYLISWIGAVLFAATDEIHQLFVPGRSGQFTDVCIDAMGCLIGLLFVMLIVHILKKHFATRRNNKIKGELS